MRPGVRRCRRTEPEAGLAATAGASGTGISLLTELLLKFDFMVDFLGRVKGRIGGWLGAHNGFAA